jgi:branched-chain amino acid transport system ATP-binding protein
VQVDAALLQISRLCSRYGRAQILNDVDLAVGRGEAVALLGRNGAGKSTLLKSVIGLIREKTGSIRFMDREISALPPFQVCRAGIGYVPEDRRIFGDLTVRENLEVGRRDRGRASRWPLERILEVFPNLAGMLDRPGGQMSGGEQQMLTIARTLQGDPDLILLDEPSEGLAPVIVEQMSAMIRSLSHEGLAILLSEQNMRFANEISDRAYIIERGTIRFSGTMREIAADEKLHADYLAV